MRRCKGIWPPSKPGRWEYPLRDFCPLFPAPAVLPSFEPMPRPTRTLRWREPLGGRKFDRLALLNALAAGLLAGLRRLLVFLEGLRPLEKIFAISLFHHFHQVTHFMDHAAHRPR